MRVAIDLEASRLVLNANTAADLMTRNPVSINQKANVKEAVALLTKKGFSIAPVIDDAGRPVGVLSSSDILVHDREHVEHLVPAVENSQHRDVLLIRHPGAPDDDMLVPSH